MALSMNKLNCQLFEMTIQFDEKNFKRDEFKLEAECDVESHNAFAFHYNSKSQSKKEHAHVDIYLSGEDSELKVRFHASRIEKGLESEDNIYSENCVKNISKFFNEDTFEARTTTVFDFDKKAYNSLIKLNYPLLLESKLLDNTTVSGHTISFPPESNISRIYLSNDEDTIAILVSARLKVVLSSFNHYPNITELEKYAQELLEKKEANND